MIRMKYCRACMILFLMSASLGLFGAEITVPRMELATRGAEEDGVFALSSTAAVDIALDGRYKFGVLLGLSFDAADLGKALAYRNFGVVPLDTGEPVDADAYNQLVDRYNNQATLSFRIAKAIARDLFGQPLEFSYFAGINDPFCSGEEFASRYGLFDISTQFTGFYYFPKGIGNNPRRRYNGLYSVQGMGASFALTKWENCIPMLYVYQDFSIYNGTELIFSKPRFSCDLRLIINRPKFQAEAYAGVSGSKGEKNEIRAGILAFFRSDKGTEFLLQCGIPGWKVDDEFSIDNLYMLFEPRLHFGTFSLYTTFFYHPLEYLHIKTEEERGKADINIKFLFGDLEKSNVQGGFEITTGVKVYTMSDYYIALSPVISFLGSGLQWDVKLRLDLLAWETPGKLFEFFTGVKTSY